ncbi:hypothetical protein HBN50_03645 [Halobacteriovorax sp. GB3]|uniref:hypothetical protein n=1 Tax=Halobacteriovorax sp. GB3 TaxID=2719615 RepID=UPI00235F9AFC|nr:hypothetical protein [Halobacteriovorax sp. GB3]MDD0852172.1 hypothetical protein [Halobacteriovorax sp. GB3]
MNWAILTIFSLIMFFISPALGRENRISQFFGAKRKDGSDIDLVTLTSSLLISWIFAKSIYNAASLGSSFGAPGGLAYATYWLSFIVAGFTIYRLRNQGFESIPQFLKSKFGSGALWLFSFILLFRLWNEIWSNTMVVGQFFGEKGSGSFIAASWLTTFLVLAYALKSGLRSSIITDLIQMALASILIAIILGHIFPEKGPVELIQTGNWNLKGGVDLIFVALIQIWSYPFHDPVMTDRGFITEKRKMLKGFILAGIFGVIFIFLFSFVGIFHGSANLGGDSVIETAKYFGLPMLVIMNLIMLTSASSTIDSTYTSAGKLVALELLEKYHLDKIKLSRITMIVLALLGNAMVHLGPEILSATTVSGTMVIGLAPIFLLSSWKKASKASFYSSVLVGLVTGIFLSLGLIPDSIGDGKYGKLLYANVIGTTLCFISFFAFAYLMPNKKGMNIEKN